MTTTRRLPRIAAAAAAVAITLVLAQGVASLARPNQQTATMVAALRGQPVPTTRLAAAPQAPKALRGSAPTVVAMRSAGHGAE